jgi:hypothetical protein
MFRVGFIKDNGIPDAKNFPTKEQAEDFILNLIDKEKIRQARIKDLDSGIEEKII